MKKRESHGMSNAPEYYAWKHIRSRTGNPASQDFKHYGGRGIELRYSSFAEFLKDIGLRPGPGFTVERIDNDGHYEPGNCRWATRLEQSQNRRCVRLITYQGKRQTISAWARELGVEKTFLRRRLDAGWTVSRAFNVPPKMTNTRAARLAREVDA